MTGDEHRPHEVGLGRDALAETAGVVTLAPDSRYRTWDAVLEDFGPDVGFIDAALTWTFHRVNVDPARLTIAGFSDGASYALALGLTNGTLFRRVIAFSPGFLYARSTQGKPPVYVAHGTSDPVLPIDSTSRLISLDSMIVGMKPVMSAWVLSSVTKRRLRNGPTALKISSRLKPESE